MDRVGSLIDITRTLISFNKLSKVNKKGRVGEANVDQQEIFSFVSTLRPNPLLHLAN